MCLGSCLCLSELAQKSASFTWRGVFRACSVRIHIDFSWSCQLNYSFLLSVGNDFTFLWGDACSPLGMVLTGCSSSAFHSTLLNFPSRPFLLMPQGQISLQQARAKPIHRVKKKDWDTILEKEGEQAECHWVSAIPEAGLLTYGIPPLPFLLPWEPAGLCSLAPYGS